MKFKTYRIFYSIGFFLIVTSLFCIDNMTKFFAQKMFLLSFSPTDVQDYFSKSITIFKIGDHKNWFDLSLTYVRNTGAAWGFLSNMNEQIRPYFFNTVTAVAIVLILIFICHTPKFKVIARFGLIFIFSGACGNFFDRFVFHYVVDWIHVRWQIFSWYYDFPVFNIADSCVTIGVSLLLIDLILTEYKGNKRGSTTIT